MTQAPLAGSGGDLAAGQTRLHLAYDAWNRLVKVYTDPDGVLESVGWDVAMAESHLPALPGQTRLHLVYDACPARDPVGRTAK